MTNHINSASPRRKRSLSPHQKQMRFFFWASMVAGYGLFAALFWLVNRR